MPVTLAPLLGMICINPSNSNCRNASLTGVLLHTSAFWINSEKIIRRISLLGSPFWFIYNFFSRAYGSAVGDILTMCSIIIAMIRHRNEESTQEK